MTTKTKTQAERQRERAKRDFFDGIEKIEQAAAAVANFESAIRAARATSEPSELLRRLHKALFRAQSKYAELTGLIRPPSSRQNESVK